jgi:hypothetical protein
MSTLGDCTSVRDLAILEYATRATRTVAHYAGLAVTCRYTTGCSVHLTRSTACEDCDLATTQHEASCYVSDAQHLNGRNEPHRHTAWQLLVYRLAQATTVKRNTSSDLSRTPSSVQWLEWSAAMVQAMSFGIDPMLVIERATQ